MRKLLFLLIGLAFFVIPTPAYSHSFGKLYTLPVPFWMYLFGASATIAVSFLVIGYFFNAKSSDTAYSTWSLSPNKVTKVLTNKLFQNVLKLVSVSIFVLTITTGLFGKDEATTNFNMTFFWIIFVLGLTYLTALGGNLYSFFNPFKILLEGYEKITKSTLEGLIKYPNFLAYYPALIFYFLFIWVELFAKTTPRSLAVILLAYCLLTASGVLLFGKEVWLRYGEFFNVFFTLLGKIAPIEFREGKVFLRPPFRGLLDSKAEHFSLLLFIMFMLSSTAFDGFHATVLATKIYYPNFHNLLQPLFGDFSYQIYQTVSLLLSPLVFLTAYLVFLQLAKKIATSSLSLVDLGLKFAFSLLPIVLAYNLAHYYTLILTEGQNMVYLISDPFGFKWNLFGTLNYRPNLEVINAFVTWNLQVAFILLGHIIGVYVAHLIALKFFSNHKKALLSHLPLLLLMILYTLTGLWILALPISMFN